MKTFSKKPGTGETQRFLPCPCCGGEEFYEIWSSLELPWQLCQGCSLIMQNPQPVVEDVLVRYDEEYFQYERGNEETFLNLMLLGLKDGGFPSGPGEGRSFLDIGCATGRLIQRLQGRGWQTQGVEVCREAAAYGQEHYGVSIFPGTLQQAAYPDGSFDYIHSSHVIEHINRPDLFLREVWRVLRFGGRFFCVTPNHKSLQGLFFGGRWRSVIDDHLFLFSRGTLIRMAQQEGLEVLKVKTWGGLGEGYAPGWLKKIADRVVKPLGWGDVMMVVLEKRLG